MNILTAPFQSLFSIRFYRQVIQSSLSKGFLYLAFLSLIAAVLLSVLMVVQFYPQMDRFMEWFRAEMPTLQWKPEGVTMDKTSPYIMKHPQYGHIATFDMSKTEVPAAELGDAMIYVTSTKLYVRQSAKRETRVYDLLNRDTKTKEANFVLNAEVVKKFERAAKPLLLGVSFLATFVFFFIWKLIAALFYSLIGLLINLFRSTRLAYENILNISLFAMTASVWIGFLQMLLSPAVRFPFGFLGSLIVTTTYLYLGIKFTEEPAPPVYT